MGASAVSSRAASVSCPFTRRRIVVDPLPLPRDLAAYRTPADAFSGNRLRGRIPGDLLVRGGSDFAYRTTGIRLRRRGGTAAAGDGGNADGRDALHLNRVRADASALADRDRVSASGRADRGRDSTAAKREDGLEGGRVHHFSRADLLLQLRIERAQLAVDRSLPSRGDDRSRFGLFEGQGALSRDVSDPRHARR